MARSLAEAGPPDRAIFVRISSRILRALLILTQDESTKVSGTQCHLTIAFNRGQTSGNSNQRPPVPQHLGKLR